VRTLGPLLVVAGLLLGADAPSKDEAAGDLEALQGNWAMVALSINGEELPEDQVKAGKLVVKGDLYTATLGERTISSTMKLDPARTPRAVDFTSTDGPQKGQTVKGIYKLDGDRLSICRALRPEDDRPDGFASGAESGLVLVVWARSKP
jgi:uncharacterized protein (TIGR03067 family)